MKDENVILNGKEITEEDLEKKKEEIEKEKDIKLVEVSKNEYKTRITG
jgi:hypothetical protein